MPSRERLSASPFKTSGVPSSSPLDPLTTAEIGKTGLRVTRLGLGGAPLGGLFESVSEADARATVAAAYRDGIRYFDTAPFYGHGTSEVRLGRALKDEPRRSFVLSTKVGRVLVPAAAEAIADHQYRDVLPLNPVFDFSRDGVLRSFQSSLERLGLERIDVLLIHDPDEHYRVALDEAFPALAQLRAEGRIAAVGAGMNQWEMLVDFARAADFDCFLLAGRYTLLDQSALAELLPECQRREIAILLGGPYNSGILAAGSRGEGHYNYQPPPPEVLKRLVGLERVAERYQVPLKAAALQFPLGHPAVVSVIPGARSAAEVEENVRMMSHRIPAAFWNELREEGLVAREAPLPKD
jgi:D-threo-aldose 1-dehydrogenase